MYVGAIIGPYADRAQVVAVCDPNVGRAELWQRDICDAGGKATVHHPDDLEAMVHDRDLDVVVVTSVDATHADLVTRALRAGADVVVEKPLATDAAGCREIGAAVRETGSHVTVTFNYRYAPRNVALRRLIADGAIGEVTSVHFEWLLDTSHGADYFRRWHRQKANSGGLLVHKASHHFDLVNWWIAATPERVYATGGLRFYGPDNARTRDLGPRPDRGSQDEVTDPFLLDLRTDERLAELYLDQEHHDGYLRDRDVFAPGITIEDNLHVVVDYDTGASMSYSLNAHAPWEGYTIGVNGTAGRAELTVVERAAVAAGHAIDPSRGTETAVAQGVRVDSERLVVQSHWEPAREVEIPQGNGGHGGGDDRLLEDVFGTPGPDPIGRAAGWVDGVKAAAVGIAGNRSLDTGTAVLVSDLGLPVSQTDEPSGAGPVAASPTAQ